MYLLLQLGGATAIGEQPIKGLVNSICGARMTVGEALTNLVFAPITDIRVGNSVICLRFLICFLTFWFIQLIYLQVHESVTVFLQKKLLNESDCLYKLIT